MAPKQNRQLHSAASLKCNQEKCGSGAKILAPNSIVTEKNRVLRIFIHRGLKFILVDKLTGALRKVPDAAYQEPFL